VFASSASRFILLSLHATIPILLELDEGLKNERNELQSALKLRVGGEDETS